MRLVWHQHPAGPQPRRGHYTGPSKTVFYRPVDRSSHSVREIPLLCRLFSLVDLDRVQKFWRASYGQMNYRCYPTSSHLSGSALFDSGRGAPFTAAAIRSGDCHVVFGSLLDSLGTAHRLAGYCAAQRMHCSATQLER